ncbi:glycoside hydrolase family 2 protein [Silvibacterium dinghuense]|uniref:Glycoside hydrolase family 2 protein n=1 Tax=Silvibacterium dinghuense TaxID=1560006 RepID=A0A4Q1SAW5_9BACT|nr:glycoside hydrolase family 2 TIM barrel-domain containing protein [Silvibacterium dinghuense]RXS94294.1 glycoside hydrolase family 2 protein [Silvibacterium dinghuense]GGH17129.1 beta-galactosidase [Silvibacterium dinghuense]
MDRREFLAFGSMYMVGSSSVARAFSPEHSPASALQSSRTVYPLSQGWLWSRNLVAGAEMPGFDDSSFTPVTLPHSNVFVSWHNFDQNAYQFVSLYRRHFCMPAEHREKRIFVDFEGAATASRVWLNGTLLGEYRGGFTPFSFELTEHVRWDQENILAVEVDGHELQDVPPFGYEIDYLTYGGIYRDVSIRVTPQTFLENVKVTPRDVLSSAPQVQVDAWFVKAAGETSGTAYTLEAELLDGATVIAQTQQRISVAEWNAGHAVLVLRNFSGVRLWELSDPVLYTVRIRLQTSHSADETTARFGFRDARFTPQGFMLNGKLLKLRGLNRHQGFPFTGPAMPARVQRRDAEILKRELKCNIVRCSHYPQSHHFLDACDELGLLVIDETPGWQHVDDSEVWRERYLDNTRRMIRRDWNHPSIVLWSVRINESRDFHDLYVNVNTLARSLDASRQTTGVRYFQESELLEDVFSMNDFGFPLKVPNHPLYLNTEFVGAEFPVRSSDNNAQHREQILRYARIYNQIAADAHYAGGLGWCAFDYQTHWDFGSGDHICYHGVMDIFREPKPAAGFYRSQCSPEEEAVLEPGFHFAENDEPGGFEKEVICSNCDEIRCSILHHGVPKPIIVLKPDHENFPHLEHPPFFLTLPDGNDDWGDLRMDGYVKGTLVISKTCSSKGIDQKFVAHADDQELIADGSDATRIALRITDEYGNVRPLCNDPISISIEGPASLLGEDIVSLSGGVMAIWVRATRSPGSIVVTARHAHLGEQKVILQSHPADRAVSVEI